MFQCPICLQVKDYLIAGKQVACESCTQAIAQYQVWLQYVDNIFRLLKLDKAMTKYDYEQAMVSIKNEDDLRNFICSAVNREVVSPCSMCGMDLNTLLKTSKPGCASCYTHFYFFLKTLINKVQDQATQHFGKSPDIVGKLQEQMEQAIKEERYEDAAKIRDKIKELG